MKHIVFILGTRPEAIKLAPVIRVCREEPSFKITILSTGQHQSMLYQALLPFNIDIDKDLELMEPSQSLNDFTSRAILALDGEFRRLKPDMVFVQGDTTTVFASALAAFHLHIPVAHIEAGLRTYDLDNPFPEEANRQLTDHISSVHFCPTLRSMENLKKENICSCHIFLSGNTIVDALSWLKQGNYFSLPDKLHALSSEKSLILVTLHRRENQGKLLEKICRQLLEFVERRPAVFLYFPVHLNPAVQSTVLSSLKHPRIILDQPLGYLQLLGVMERCTLIVTDSGGIQEEAPSFNKFVLVLRKRTERPESIQIGAGVLFNPENDGLPDFLEKCLDQNTGRKQFINPYGDGEASRRIKDYLLWMWGMREEKPEEFRGGGKKGEV